MRIDQRQQIQNGAAKDIYPTEKWRGQRIVDAGATMLVSRVVVVVVVVVGPFAERQSERTKSSEGNPPLCVCAWFSQPTRCCVSTQGRGLEGEGWEGGALKEEKRL